MTTQMICRECGRPVQPAYTGGTAAFIAGHCSCNPPMRAEIYNATESHPFSQYDELRQLRTFNHYMTEELTRLRAERKAEFLELSILRAKVEENIKWCMDVLTAQSCERHASVTMQEYVDAEISAGCAQCARADLTEARADVARFEAALDAANRELAQARAELANELTERDAARAEAKRLQDLIERRRIERDDIRASAARWEERALKAEAELAQARAVIDDALTDLEQARADRDEALSEAKKSWAFVGNVTDSTLDLLLEIERQRRTIRALVVACRALRQTAWNWRMDGMSVRDVVLDVRARVGHINKQSGQQAGE